MAKILRIIFSFMISLSYWALAQSAPPAKSAIPEFKNLAAIATRLNLQKFTNSSFHRKIRIAILDNGFQGYEAEVGKRLPANTQYRSGAASDADKRTSSQYSTHGTLLATVIAELLRMSGARVDYELHLFNAFGRTKFADSVNTIIHERFDIAVHALHWEWAGNGDGKGWINAIVDRALDANIVWLNAAGPFGILTRVAAIAKRTQDREPWVMFGGKTPDHVPLRCVAKLCRAQITLAWNDFKNEPRTGTDKDLDLFLYQKNKLIAAGQRIQKIVTADIKKESRFPSEFFTVAVGPGLYKLRAKIKSQNFDPTVDRLRITVDGFGFKMENPSVKETLLPPGDNERVIVIGGGDADDFAHTSKSASRGLPRIFLPSQITFQSDISGPLGSSNATAVAAAIAVLEMGTGRAIDRYDVEQRLIGYSIVDPTAKTAKKPTFPNLKFEEYE